MERIASLRKTPRPSGFTLIELLIVVAIIAILAAIAVPNFLEAQVRAKVGRVKADLRTIATALEAYSIDYNGRYAILNGYTGTGYNNQDRGGIFVATGLTTPVSYLSSVNMPDPFVKVKAIGKWSETDGDDKAGNHGAESSTYHYVNVPLTRKNYANLKMDGRSKYFLISFGPDYLKGPLSDAVVRASSGHGGNDGAMQAWLADYATAKATADNPNLTFDAFCYDPSNGSISGGDILRHQ